MNVVSIQSQVVYGFAGNTAAVPVLQHLGATVWPVPTAMLSNTPIYPSVGGGPIKAVRLTDLLDGLMDRVGAESVDAILTGYMATVENVRATAAFIERVKTANPTTLYCCDPVMGDARKGLYVPDQVAESIIDSLAPMADILIPNLFEAAFLTRSEEPEPVGMARGLLALGARIGVVKSVRQDGFVTNIGVDRTGDWTARCPRLDAQFTGTGDAFSAAFLGYYLQSSDVSGSLDGATQLVFRLIEHAKAAGLSEIDVAALANLQRPR